MLGLEIPNNERIGNHGWVKPSPLVLDDYRHSLAHFTPAIDLNELDGIELVAMKNRIVESLPKCKLDGWLFAENAMRFFDQSHHSVHQWGNSFGFTRHSGLNFEGGIVSMDSHELCSQTRWNIRLHNDS